MNQVIRKLHQSFKRKAHRNRIRQEIKHRRLENIRALIEYRNIKSSDSDQSESESETIEEQYIISSEEDGSSTEENIQVENEICPSTNHSNEAENFSSSEDDLLFQNDEERQQYVIESLRE